MTGIYKYKGYNTTPFTKNKTTALKGVDLLIADLDIAFRTNIDERPVSDFGSSIFIILGQPMTEITVSQIEIEARRILEYDPRLKLMDFSLTPDFELGYVRIDATLKIHNLSQEIRYSIKLEFET